MNHVVTHESVAAEINNLIEQYEFPVEVLKDVNYRLQGAHDPHYAAQQLRYLQNVVEAGIAKLK